MVVGPGDKKRLVLNLRYLNQFLRKDQFKYEDLKTAMQIFKPGDFMFKFDLKSGYHHRKYLQVPLEVFRFCLECGWDTKILCVYCPPIWASNCLLCVYKDC